jgi:uncharacterized protein YbaR (Trm112 family)
MAVAKHLLEILRCPESQGELIYFANGSTNGNDEFLFCPDSKLRYRIDEGIPVMLIDDAERLDDAACAALSTKASELGLI